MQLQLQFMENIIHNIHNARKTVPYTIAITIHEKHLIYTIQLQLQFMKNI